ncbi:GNAT family N-acetyltransferase [Daejeonia sp. YH14]|uniref:GNAT family N-acetyltransferase n=1 Tax=Daejeonia sp. YH14 TaxID=3439042 RepID=UPI003F499D85
MTDLIWKIKNFAELTVPELYAIMKARIDVFVVEQECPYPDADQYDQKAIHLWAENKKGEVMAYCRIFGQNIKYRETSVGRVLTTSGCRGKNTGRQLMKFALETIENRFRTRNVRISAQDYLLEFYKSFGFEDTGKKYWEDQIPHTEMLRQ